MDVASLVDQVSLALEHNLPNIVGPAGAKLCARAQPLTLSESRCLGIDAAYAIWTLRERLRGDGQTVSFSDVAYEEQRVQAFFEETGLIRTVERPRGRSEISDSASMYRPRSRRRPSSSSFPSRYDYFHR